MKQRFLVQELPRNIPGDNTALYALIGGTWFFLCHKVGGRLVEEWLLCGITGQHSETVKG